MAAARATLPTRSHGSSESSGLAPARRRDEGRHLSGRAQSSSQRHGGSRHAHDPDEVDEVEPDIEDIDSTLERIDDRLVNIDEILPQDEPQTAVETAPVEVAPVEGETRL